MLNLKGIRRLRSYGCIRVIQLILPMLQKTTKFAVFSHHLGDYQQEQYDALLSDFSFEDSKDASLRERRTTNSQNKLCLTYGEISSIEPIRNVFGMIRKHGGLTSFGGKFYDLGSGIGKPVFAAALLHKFDSCIGIEVLQNLHNIGVQVKHKYDATIKETCGVNVELFCGSILELSAEKGGVDWTDGDVVFANSTCFEPEMMVELSRLGSRLKSGAFFITLSRPLEYSDGFTLLEEARYDMSW